MSRLIRTGAAALAALKRKKLHEDSYNKVQDKILMLQQQQHGIQELQMNVETFGALKKASAPALRTMP